jgi:hypothetical protein
MRYTKAMKKAFYADVAFLEGQVQYRDAHLPGLYSNGFHDYRVTLPMRDGTMFVYEGSARSPLHAKLAAYYSAVPGSLEESAYLHPSATVVGLKGQVQS